MNTPEKLRITILGSGTSAGVPMIGCHCSVCSSPDPRDKRSRPSIALHYNGKTVLIDTTPELRLQAIANNLDRVDAVLFTHAHADHIFGLDDVRRYNTLNHAPLPLYATAETLQKLKESFAYAFKPPLPPSEKKDALYRPELLPTIIDPNTPFTLFNEKITPIPLIHGRFQVLGFRLQNFAYCTDCNEIPTASRALLQNLDTLIIDALRPKPHPTHLSFDQALQIINDLKPKRAYFTHLSHDLSHTQIESTLPPHIRVLYDGLTIASE